MGRKSTRLLRVLPGLLLQKHSPLAGFQSC